jgi:hypothetical protein
MDYGLRINGLTAEDLSYNVYAFRADVKRWDRKILTARKEATRAQYMRQRDEAAASLAYNERSLQRLRIRTTLDYLRRCRAARKAGHAVSYTTDPAWLVEQALNRRAGWPDDPSCSRGSCRPVNGTYPKKASGGAYHDLQRLSRQVNSRASVRLNACGMWRKLIATRLPHRLFSA